MSDILKLRVDGISLPEDIRGRKYVNVRSLREFLKIPIFLGGLDTKLDDLVGEVRFVSNGTVWHSKCFQVSPSSDFLCFPIRINELPLDCFLEFSIFDSFLFLKEKESISIFFRRMIYGSFKKRHAENIIEIAEKADNLVYAYFLGKLIEAAIFFVVLGVGYFILGVPYAIGMAGALAVLNFIPYIGAILALVPIIMLTIMLGSTQAAVGALIFSLIALFIIGTFVSPVVIGKKININEFLMLIAIMIGGALYGIGGMLLAPPVMALISVLVGESLKVKEAKMAIQNTVDSVYNSKRPASSLSELKNNNMQMEEDIDI